MYIKIKSFNKVILGITAIFTMELFLLGCNDAQVDKVAEGISKLPSANYITIKDKESIDKIKGEFDKLSKEQQEKIKDAVKLKQDEAAIKAIEDSNNFVNDDFKKSQQVSEEIKNLDTKDTQSVDKVKKAYMSLSEAQKCLVIDTNKIGY